MISQTIRRSQLIHPSLYIMYELKAIPRIGTNGTHGVRNGLACPGFVFRRTMMAVHTMMKASRVPIFTIFPISSIGVTLPTMAATSPTSMVFFQGVLNLEWISAKNRLGSSPSLAMARSEEHTSELQSLRH